VSGYHFEGARVILPDAVIEVSVTVEGHEIAAIDGPAGSAARVDARGIVLAPALIDIHRDAFERQVMPRPGTFVPMDVAMLETDRQLAANGIATAYHALTLSWEPGLRSVESGAAYVEALSGLAPRLTVENRLQLRWEIFAFEALELIDRALAGPLLPSIAFNDHTSMAMRAFDMPVTDRPFDLGEADIAPLSDGRMKQRTAGNARRAGMTNEAYVELLGQVWERRGQVAAVVAEVAQKGSAKGVPMLSHDDSQPEMRRFYSELGAKVAEFPTCETTARDARARGEWVVLGAPNVMRGGSHIGSLHAADMIEDGVCDVLASDYYYPAMLAAIGHLHRERRAGLAELWRLVAANPAAASGLTDRGEIAPGKRADLVLLDWPEGATPAVRMTLSNGTIAAMAGELMR